MREHLRLASGLIGTAQRAGRAIMAHYGQGGAVELKPDSSPVTAADREAEAHILRDLAALAAGVPVISEEAALDRPIAPPGRRFFLVDPLDGTKEFINGETDFTVNIALVEDRAPRFGLVYAPARSALFVTLAPDRAVEARLDPAGPEPRLDDLAVTELRTRRPDPAGLVAVVSRSHLNAATEAFLRPLPIRRRVQAGSSLKFCLLAQGRADVYPRLARTMEWDTAAGHAILAAAGGVVLEPGGAPFGYGKTALGYANPGFVAWGRTPDQG